MRQFPAQQDGQRVWLSSIRTACAPYAQAPIFGVPRDKIGQNQVAKGIEVLAMAKEIGFSDRDLFDERIHFGGALGGIAQ